MIPRALSEGAEIAGMPLTQLTELSYLQADAAGAGQWFHRCRPTCVFMSSRQGLAVFGSSTIPLLSQLSLSRLCTCNSVQPLKLSLSVPLMHSKMLDKAEKVD